MFFRFGCGRARKGPPVEYGAFARDGDGHRKAPNPAHLGQSGGCRAGFSCTATDGLAPLGEHARNKGTTAVVPGPVGADVRFWLRGCVHRPGRGGAHERTPAFGPVCACLSRLITSPYVLRRFARRSFHAEPVCSAEHKAALSLPRAKRPAHTGPKVLLDFTPCRVRWRAVVGGRGIFALAASVWVAPWPAVWRIRWQSCGRVHGALRRGGAGAPRWRWFWFCLWLGCPPDCGWGLVGRSKAGVSGWGRVPEHGSGATRASTAMPFVRSAVGVCGRRSRWLSDSTAAGWNQSRETLCGSWRWMLSAGGGRLGGMTGETQDAVGVTCTGLGWGSWNRRRGEHHTHVDAQWI